MAEYHVYCGAIGIYAGTLNEKGDMWLHKSEVTDEAMSAVAEHMVMHNGHMTFNYKGERYILKVEKLGEGAEDGTRRDDFYCADAEGREDETD